MAAFTVWKFEDPDGAGEAASRLDAAASDGLVKIVDHAVLSWPVGESRPTLKHGHDEARHGTGWGALWGLLAGTLFMVPLAGAAAGAAIGAISKATQGTGITKDELEKIRAQVTEGTSALFAVTEEGNLDRLGERFRDTHWKLVDANLTEAERRLLVETFGGGS